MKINCPICVDDLFLTTYLSTTMNKTLYLIRHSYAESPNGKSDKDRTLTLEGQSTARALGRHLINEKFDPDIILCSTAERTRETAINLVEELEMNEQSITYSAKIYDASVRELLEIVNELEDGNKSVAIIGHNPTITFFGEYLTGASIGNMEPSSIVKIRFESKKWDQISQSSGIFVSYYHPSH
jgi:phosphohistidine phosphatase